jgi:hypothetical protein
MIIGAHNKQCTKPTMVPCVSNFGITKWSVFMSKNHKKRLIKQQSQRFVLSELAGLTTHMDRIVTGILSGVSRPAQDKDYMYLALNLNRLSNDLKEFGGQKCAQSSLPATLGA